MSAPEVQTDEKAHILMRYRGAVERRERVLDSGPHAVADFLSQFEGEEKVAVALSIAGVLGEAIQESREAEDEMPAFYTTEVANPEIAAALAESATGLRWIASVASISESVHRPSQSSGNKINFGGG